jgi:hypothetical protein
VLTDARCRSAKAQEKPYKLADAKGLYLYVTPTGYKSWRWKYRLGRVEKRIIFGPYPEISLSEARDLRDEAARLKRQGADPAEARKEQAANRTAAADNTFETIARRWHEARLATWSASHAKKVLASLETEVFPKLGAKPIKSITGLQVLEVLQPIEQRGAIDQAHRIRQRMSDVFGFGMAAGVADSDPASVVRKALKPVKKGRYPALRKIEDARELLRVTEEQPAHPLTKLASRLMAITAVRSEPLRFATPAEFEGLDGKQPVWRIPAAKMKLQLEQKEDESFEFLVPLPWQAVEVVKAALQLVRGAPLLFPSVRHAHKPMSENALSTMYKRFPQFAGRHVPHGWRSTFSTIMNERAVAMDRPEDRAIIDLMLAHKPEGVEAAYNRAAYMPRRRQLAQDWADLLIVGLVPAEQLLGGRRRT